MRLILFFFSVLAFSLTALAQKHDYYWYFGNGAGIEFHSGKPKTLQNSNLFTEEGSASVSDSEGRLLFYTNGVKVWNRQHNLMPNGTGLWGHVSSTQSALIVKKPGSTTLFYIFTIDEKGRQNGLCYSIVDMMKQRQPKETRMKNEALLTPDLLPHLGKGDITIKNKQLLTPVSEKLTAVRHSNGTAIWVIAHKWNSDAFYAYPVTPDGIGKPVISSVGAMHRNESGRNNGEAIGYLKPSHDGKLLASAMCYKPNSPVEIFSFDNATGKVSDLRNIPTSGYAYGLEFSPDNSKLYVSFLKGKSGITQYDLTADDLFDSGTIVATNDANNIFGALQIGPDKKIYVARIGSYLDAINNPDKAGNKCEYQRSAVHLGKRNCVYGMPNMPVLSMERKSELSISASKQTGSEKMKSPALKINLGNDTVLCNYSMRMDAGNPKASYLWSTGQTTRLIAVTKSGQYWVKIEKNGLMAADTINITFKRGGPEIKLKREITAFCKSKVALDCGVKAEKYLWSTSETTREITVSKGGSYSVTVTDNECNSIARTKVIFDGKPSVFSYLPEFEPENPMFNNYFAYTINDVDKFELKIFSGGGKLLFKTDNPNEKWYGKNKSGKIVPKGKYKWEINYKPTCSEKAKKEMGTLGVKRL
ncbi:MAG: hypothetical protein COA57_03330 [Flavobacteriales bacterium]|nr:MAG: hypothetical protein COA57_03330 [Flavobacteriales bacterium]